MIPRAISETGSQVENSVRGFIQGAFDIVQTKLNKSRH